MTEHGRQPPGLAPPGNEIGVSNPLFLLNPAAESPSTAGWRKSRGLISRIDDYYRARKNSARSKRPCCCGRCSRTCCAISVVVALGIAGLLVGLLYFRYPDFEPDLETLEIAELGFEGGFAVELSVDLELINNNFLPVEVFEIESTLTFRDLVIDVDLLDEEVLPPRSVTVVPSVLRFSVGLREFPSVGILITQCLFGSGVAEFLLQTIATGQYLGVTSDLEYPDEDFPLPCSPDDLIGGDSGGPIGGGNGLPFARGRAINYLNRFKNEVNTYEEFYSLMKELKTEFDL